MLSTLCLCGCGKETVGTKGYAQGHWSKIPWIRDKISNTLVRINKPNLDDKRVCFCCNQEKLVSEFYGKTRGKFCNDCRQSKNIQRLRKRTKEQQKDCFIKSKYKITIEQYKEMLDKQHSLCMICNKPETRKNQYGLCMLHIDHNHETGKVRGLLCHKCNTILGYCREDVEVLKKAIEYLTRNK